MSEEQASNKSGDAAESAKPAAPPPPALDVAPGPHVSVRGFTMRRMMLDVLIALVPLVVAAVWVFGAAAIFQVAVCVITAVAVEAVFLWMRGKCWKSITDGSAVVTGVILALSLPWSCPWYVSVIASVVAVGIGKAVFGGLGQNMFNPAMVGRAFVMLGFSALGAAAYQDAESANDVVTSATPMSVMKKYEEKAATARRLKRELPARGQDENNAFDLRKQFLGDVNGSLGETSALACLLGGLFLCLRRTASWQIPLGVLLGAGAIAGLTNALDPGTSFTALHHLLGGALLFGAFFIATDPVSSPVTPKGKWIFAVALGALVMMIRTCANYPEGVMFAVLLMNALVPLINRWTIPTPVGGPVPKR